MAAADAGGRGVAPSSILPVPCLWRGRGGDDDDATDDDDDDDDNIDDDEEIERADSMPAVSH